MIMAYQFPVVIEPIYEPPDRGLELIDKVFEVHNNTVEPNSKEYFQFNRVGKYHYDGNIASNFLKILPNGLADLMNSGVDAVNAVIYDAQYIADRGLFDYVGRLKKAGANDIKNITKGTTDLIQHGPNKAMHAVTSADLNTLKKFFGSALYAENWEAAILVALGMAVSAKPVGTICKYR